MIAEYCHQDTVDYQSLIFLVKNAFLGVGRKDPSVLSPQSYSLLTLYLRYFRDNSVVMSATMTLEAQRVMSGLTGSARILRLTVDFSISFPTIQQLLFFFKDFIYFIFRER